MADRELVSSDLSLTSLKSIAGKVGAEPRGNKKHKDTWVEAIRGAEDTSALLSVNTDGSVSYSAGDSKDGPCSWPLSFKYSKWLLGTSILFTVLPFGLGPALASWLGGDVAGACTAGDDSVWLGGLLMTSLLTTIASVNYWRDARNGWRRNLDLVTAKLR